MLNADMVGQVVPANLPFSVLHHNGELAVYAEELTFGRGSTSCPDSSTVTRPLRASVRSWI